MKKSRRRFVIASTGLGSALCAGCLAGPPSEGDGNSGNGGDDDDGESSENECDPIDLELLDEPPHGPERPPHPEGTDDEDGWDDHHLGEGMDDDSDLSFDRITLTFQKPVVDEIDAGGGSAFYAELITSQEEFDESVEPIGDDSETRAAAIDFDEEAVIVVLSGFGSSSVRHEWVRVDEHCEEVHVHGYYVWPYVQTDDYTSRVSGVVIERPDEHELERAWVSLTVDEHKRANFHTDDDVQVVDGDDGDEGGEDIDGHGAVDQVDVVPATREFEGDWYSDGLDEIGTVFHLDDEDELRTVVDGHEEVERFVDGTNFEEDAVFYLESAGPNACYRKIDVSDVQVIAYDDGYFARGTATVVDDSDDGEVCAEVVTFPAALIRVESDVDVQEAEFRIIDGWGNEETVDSITMAELARE